MFSPKVTLQQGNMLSVPPYISISPTERTLVLTDLELIPLPSWSVGDAVWQQNVVQQSQWVPQLLCPNLGFILILNIFTKNTLWSGRQAALRCFQTNQPQTMFVFPVIHFKSAKLTFSHGKF